MDNINNNLINNGTSTENAGPSEPDRNIINTNLNLKEQENFKLNELKENNNNQNKNLEIEPKDVHEEIVNKTKKSKKDKHRKKDRANDRGKSRSRSRSRDRSKDRSKRDEKERTSKKNKKEKRTKRKHSESRKRKRSRSLSSSNESKSESSKKNQEEKTQKEQSESKEKVVHEALKPEQIEQGNENSLANKTDLINIINTTEGEQSLQLKADLEKEKQMLNLAIRNKLLGYVDQNAQALEIYKNYKFVDINSIPNIQKKV